MDNEPKLNENAETIGEDTERGLEKDVSSCNISIESADIVNADDDLNTPNSPEKLNVVKSTDDIVTDQDEVDSDQKPAIVEKIERLFTIGEYGKKELTIGEQPLIKNNTIEELKLKLERKELLFRPRPNTPTSPASPTTPTKSFPGEDPEDMIPETRTPPLLTDDGLIAPRKPANPVREDPGRQNLHRELLFNQKIGKSVLNQKSELQRALEKHKDNIAKRQLENHVAEKTPELEKVIADRARRLEKPVKPESEEDKVINKEFLQARMKLKSTSDSK